MANLPFDIANFNLTNFANIYPDVMDSTPAYVSYQYKDSNGNILTKTIANRGKFKEQIWDDVGGALGQFYRTFYVDAENGDDNNDGSSSTPFKTLKKAYDSVPSGGYGDIILLSDVVQDSICTLVNKKIVVNFNEHSLTHGWYVSSDYAYLYRTYLKSSELTYYIRALNDTDNIKQYLIIPDNDTGVTASSSGFMAISYYTTQINSTFTVQILCSNGVPVSIGKDATLCSQSTSSNYTRKDNFLIGGYYGTKDIVINSNAYLLRIYGTISGDIDLTNFNLKDENGDAIDSVKDRIYGITTDADTGLPTNFFCGIRE